MKVYDDPGILNLKNKQIRRRVDGGGPRGIQLLAVQPRNLDAPGALILSSRKNEPDITCKGPAVVGFPSSLKVLILVNPSVVVPTLEKGNAAAKSCGHRLALASSKDFQTPPCVLAMENEPYLVVEAREEPRRPPLSLSWSR